MTLLEINWGISSVSLIYIIFLFAYMFEIYIYIYINLLRPFCVLVLSSKQEKQIITLERHRDPYLFQVREKEEERRSKTPHHR